MPEHVLHRLVGRALVAERLRQRTGRVRLRRLQRLDDLVLLGARRLGELGDRRRAAEIGRLRLDRPRQPHAQLLHAARHVERPGPVAEVALDLADDRRHRVGRELHLPLGVEALDREEQADRADLDQVLLRLPATRVARGQALHQRHVPLDELRRGPARLRRGTPRSSATKSTSCAVGLMPRRLGGWRRRRARPSPRRADAPRPPGRRAGRARVASSGSSTRPERKLPSRTRSSVDVASVSSLIVSPSGSWRSTLSTARSRSSTRSSGNSKRAAIPPSTSRPTFRNPTLAGNSTVVRSAVSVELTRSRSRGRARRRDRRGSRRRGRAR